MVSSEIVVSPEEKILYIFMLTGHCPFAPKEKKEFVLGTYS